MSSLNNECAKISDSPSVPSVLSHVQKYLSAVVSEKNCRFPKRVHDKFALIKAENHKFMERTKDSRENVAAFFEKNNFED